MRADSYFATGYFLIVEDLSDVRTLPGQRRVLARQGRVGEIKIVFSFLPTRRLRRLLPGPPVSSAPPSHYAGACG